MRGRFARLPSPAVAVAFLALLAALAGTAVALPGSNTVTSGDITNGAVKTADIRNSTVRGRDVRNNTLTGSDINEGSLGTVPRANAAGTANTANLASIAGAAGLAGNVARRQITGQVGAQDGQTDVPVASAQGFRLELDCDTGGDAVLKVENVSAGDEAHISANVWNVGEYDFQQGDEFEVASSNAGGGEDSAFAVIAPGGEVLFGKVMVGFAEGTDFGGPDCFATANLDG